MICLRRIGLATTALLAVSGCGGGLVESRGDAVEEGGSYLLVAPEEVGEAGVGFIGTTLTLVDHCVGLEFDDGSVAVVIWPHGTRWVSADPLAIDLPGVGRVEEGDGLEGGGDNYEGPHPLPDVDVPPSCQDAALVSFTPDQ